MDINTITSYFLDGFITFVIALIIRYGIPFLRTALKGIKLTYATKLVDRAVKAAEQKVQGSKLGSARKTEAIAMIEKAGLKVDTFIEDLIESAVKEMNDALTALPDALIKIAETATDGKVNQATVDATLEAVESVITEEATKAE
jgi:hypothetical protein